MHRRARHFNAKDMGGASLILDARRLSGAEGSDVATWADTSGNSRDYSQSTAGSRPTLQLGVYGGMPTVRFNGSQFLQQGGAINDSNNLSESGAYTCFFVSKFTSTRMMMGDNGVNGQSFFGVGTTAFFLWRNTSDAGMTSSYTAPSTLVGYTGIRAGTSTNQSNIYANGASIATGTVSGTVRIGMAGGRVISSQRGTGDICFYAHFSGKIFDLSQKKRVEQASAFSFKFSCS